MKKSAALSWMIMLFALGCFASSSMPAPAKLKVFISVDMEGIGGLASGEETSPAGRDYGLFRQLMTEEANAAIEGALQAGATEVVVRDAHGSALNILPNLLNPEARLVREWSLGPLDMMEGIDRSFDAVFFVGYHAQAGTPNAVLAHTITGTIYDLKLNGRAVPELGLNAAIAGYFGVPVVLVTGDLATTRQATDVLGDVATVAVKEGIGKAAIMLHPEKARKLIKAAAAEALKNLPKYKPFRLTPPVTMEITFTREDLAAKASMIPGARRTGNRSAAFTHQDLLEVMKFYLIATA
jgi:D-amino peptidase